MMKDMCMIHADLVRSRADLDLEHLLARCSADAELGRLKRADAGRQTDSGFRVAVGGDAGCQPADAQLNEKPGGTVRRPGLRLDSKLERWFGWRDCYSVVLSFLTVLVSSR